MNDDKQPSFIRGWLKNEYRRVLQYKTKFGKQKIMRLPKGYDLAHWRGYENAKGFNYNYSELNQRSLHKLQHKYDNYGKNNKFKVSKKCGMK
nr:polymorphic toxin type 8 domain-containing protein [Pelistega ratti]